jgi:murein DD-endopeptidase
MKRNVGLAILVTAAITQLATSSASADQPAIVQAFDLRVPLAPRMATVGNAPTLVHELHINSYTSRATIIDRIELVDDSSGGIVGTLTGAELATPVGAPLNESATLAPNGRAVIYVNLPLPDSRAPEKIRHRVHFRFADDDPNLLRSVDASPVRLDSRPLPQLGPPLRSGPWIAAYDPKMAFGHRRMVLATDGAARIPGRFAIDFFGIDASGRTASDASGRLDRYFGHGAEVLAVADAVVVAARDGMTEPATTNQRKKVALADETGNYIALDLGGGRYAFYEHLQPGLLVKQGDRVRRGQVIARLGLTGSGSQPHLHFHVADAKSPLGAEGLPYCMRSIEVLGGYSTITAAFEGRPWKPVGSRLPQENSCMPGPNTVVRFPSQRTR